MKWIIKHKREIAEYLTILSFIGLTLFGMKRLEKASIKYSVKYNEAVKRGR